MLVALCGHAQHGKDTVASALPNFKRVAFADPVKQIALALNPIITMDLNLSGVLESCGNSWDEAKKVPEVRRILQRIGTECIREIIGDNIWIDLAVKKIKEIKGDVVVTDLRFPNEAAAIRKLGGYIWRVSRPNFDNGVDRGHPSEKLVAEIDFDYFINNNNTIEELRIKALKALIRARLNDFYKI